MQMTMIQIGRSHRPDWGVPSCRQWRLARPTSRILISPASLGYLVIVFGEIVRGDHAQFQIAGGPLFANCEAIDVGMAYWYICELASIIAS